LFSPGNGASFWSAPSILFGLALHRRRIRESNQISRSAGGKRQTVIFVLIEVDLMTWKIKAKSAKQTTEVISDDPKYAIFKVDQWRSQGLEVWIEDINGNKVDEAALRKAAGQTSPQAPPLNYKFD
jgi:hypothetical protein